MICCIQYTSGASLLCEWANVWLHRLDMWMTWHTWCKDVCWPCWRFQLFSFTFWQLLRERITHMLMHSAHFPFPKFNFTWKCFPLFADDFGQTACFYLDFLACWKRHEDKIWNLGQKAKCRHWYIQRVSSLAWAQSVKFKNNIYSWNPKQRWKVGPSHRATIWANHSHLLYIFPPRAPRKRPIRWVVARSSNWPPQFAPLTNLFLAI